MRSLLAPEVVQTSAMDCGPASLKCLLEGFGVHASYGRLREACQTEVDGTSIDTLEEIATRLGLEASQIMIPADHVLLEESAALPAVVVVTLPNGFSHFVVAWRRHGPWLQVMDPATGRRFVLRDAFLSQLYVHQTSVPAEGFREWASSDDFVRPLWRRMQNVGCTDRKVLESACMGAWQDIAALDAATRLVAALVKSGALERGNDAARLLVVSALDPSSIPSSYFTARPAPEIDGEPHVYLRGAVLLRVSGAGDAGKSHSSEEDRSGNTGALPRDLAAALAEPPPRPMRELLQMVALGGWLTPSALLIALLLAAFGALVEAVLLRAALELPHDFSTVRQRLGAAALLIAFATGLRVLDLPIGASTLRLGRQLEVRLRRAFLEKIPRLKDRYFQSRPISDMAERAHAIQTVRTLPELAATFTRTCAELLATACAIAWLDPRSAGIAFLAVLLAVVLPVLFQPVLLERDLRVRTHGGALARLMLDALLGLMPLRTHGAESSIRREHESLLVKWGEASRALVQASAFAGATQYMAVVSLVVWMVVRFITHAADTSGILLLVYWGLAFPMLSEELASVFRQYPAQRNVTLRLMEPLGALEDARDVEVSAATNRGPVGIVMNGVGIVAGGHDILRDISLRIEAGEAVAVVGPSGAGKSSLVGLLLGLHEAARGELLVDGETLAGANLERLRRATAWVDPSVQVWNRALLENLQYGAEASAAEMLGRVLEGADVQPLLDRLPEGMQTALGEGGALVSGGEGQRVRFGRAMMRPNARLVVLDEPFRGLDRDRRRVLLHRARSWWKGATMLCITHDVAETLEFDRVLVVDGGCIVEDGRPRELAEQIDTRYRALLDAERTLLDVLWGGSDWRRLRLERGLLIEKEHT